MNVGVVGLGLIGGSLAKSYKKRSDATVYGYDINKSIEDFARISGAVDVALRPENAGECDLLLIALPPDEAIEYLRTVAPHVSPQAMVIDCCGVKREVCRVGFELAQQYGFTYAGGHPMAGTHHSGFRSSTPDLFEGACMVIVPPAYDDIVLYERIKSLLAPAAFDHLSITTAEKHDELIAFTSQMAHIISNAFIKSPTAQEHRGFSAGSYRDLTRVAWLNPRMWTELFMANKDNLLKELDIFINSINQYRDALQADDFDRLCRLLDEGRKLKEKVDG